MTWYDRNKGGIENLRMQNIIVAESKNDIDSETGVRNIAWPRGIDPERTLLVNRVARALVERWKDYAPTEAAFRGDECLRNGDIAGQHLWLYIIIASENILNLRSIE